jgi:hypothetical protein
MIWDFYSSYDVHQITHNKNFVVGATLQEPLRV